MDELNNRTNVFKLSLYNLPSSNVNYILPVDNTFPTAILVVDAQMTERTSTGFKCKIESIDQTFTHGCYDVPFTTSEKPWIGNRIPYKIIDNKQINGKLSELSFEFDPEAFLTYGQLKISGIQRSTIASNNFILGGHPDILETNYDFDKTFYVQYSTRPLIPKYVISFKIVVSPKMREENEIFKNDHQATPMLSNGTNVHNSFIFQTSSGTFSGVIAAFVALSIGKYANCIEEVWVEADQFTTQSSMVYIEGVWFSIMDTSPTSLYSTNIEIPDYMTINNNPTSTSEYILNVDGQEYSYNKYLLRKKLGNKYSLELTQYPSTSSSGCRIVLSASNSTNSIILASANRESYSLNSFNNHKESWWQSNKNQWEAGMVLGAIEALIPALGSLFTAGSASGLAMGAINVLGKSAIRSAMDDDLDNIPMGGGGDGGTAVNSNITLYDSYVDIDLGKANYYKLLYNPSSSFHVIPDDNPISLNDFIFQGHYASEYCYIQGEFKLNLSNTYNNTQLAMSPAEKKMILKMLSEGVRMGYR